MAAMELLWHYLEYIFSPAVLLALLGVVGPIFLGISAERAATASKEPGRVRGCRRLGMQNRSNLANQYQAVPKPEGPPRVHALFTYPIKSCRGVELAASEVHATGLKYDRLFTFAQLISKQNKAPSDGESGVSEPSSEWTHQWRFITQREFPRLALIQTELWLPDPTTQKPVASVANGRPSKHLRTPSGKQRQRSRTRGNTLVGQLERGGRKNSGFSEDWVADGGCLVVRFPFEPDFNPFGWRTEKVTLRLPLVPSPQRQEAKRYEREELSIWKDCPLAINVTNEIDAVALNKLKYFLGVSNPLALFRVDEKNRRAVTRCLPKDKDGVGYEVGFADAFSINLLGLPSVRATDNELPTGVDAKGNLDARRFRANIYISGTAEAFEEDTWKKLTVGSRIGRDKDGLFEVEAEYHVACRTARCKLPNVDPDTGIKDKNEPYTTLGKTRRVDKGADPNPCLGMQMIPRFEMGIIRVGDEIEVLETGEHCYEKMFK